MKVVVKGLTCANCAGKIEAAVLRLPTVNHVAVNLVKETMDIGLDEGAVPGELFPTVESIVHKFEPQVAVSLVAEKSISHEEDHEHSHSHGDKEEDPKKLWVRFGLGILLFLAAVIWEDAAFSTPLFLVSYGIFGYDVLWRAVRNISHGQVFDENFLMSISTIGAIAIGEIPEAVFVMLFYQVGEAFQEFAVRRSRKSITALLEIRPEYAEVVQGDGSIRRIRPEEVKVGDVILVKAGERIPLDGTITQGRALLDTAALTGEALPREVGLGSDVLSGCINLDGTLEIQVVRPFGESTVMKILEMVENAAGRKSKTERFITRFARVYTPVVVGLAVLLAIFPPLLGAGAFEVWLGRALIFLVVSCPCALVLSVPLTYFAGIGAASKKGILVKGGGDLDTLCNVHRVVFDKTGTITKGQFSVVEIMGENQKELMQLAAAGEAMSNHPIAKAVVEKYKEGQGEVLPSVTAYQELGGFGISYELQGEEIFLGSRRLMETKGIGFTAYTAMGTVIYVARGGVFLGYIVVADTIKDGCAQAFADLRSQGVKEIIMLTGDRRENGEAVAEALGIDRVYSELLPQDKVRIMEEIKGEEATLKTIFVGDGINDAPVLAGADLGVAMGGLGSDAAIEAADVVLMDDNLEKLAVAIGIARRTRVIIRQNITFALGVKAVVLVLSTVGLASMWMAVFADVGVTVLAVLNAMRRK